MCRRAKRDIMDGRFQLKSKKAEKQIVEGHVELCNCNENEHVL